jgi:hypothetical protein
MREGHQAQLRTCSRQREAVRARCDRSSGGRPSRMNQRARRARLRAAAPSLRPSAATAFASMHRRTICALRCRANALTARATKFAISSRLRAAVPARPFQPAASSARKSLMAKLMLEGIVSGAQTRCPISASRLRWRRSSLRFFPCIAWRDKKRARWGARDTRAHGFRTRPCRRHGARARAAARPRAARQLADMAATRVSEVACDRRHGRARPKSPLRQRSDPQAGCRAEHRRASIRKEVAHSEKIQCAPEKSQ